MAVDGENLQAGTLIAYCDQSHRATLLERFSRTVSVIPSVPATRMSSSINWNFAVSNPGICKKCQAAQLRFCVQAAHRIRRAVSRPKQPALRSEAR